MTSFLIALIALSGSLTWLTDLDTAKQQATNHNKHILLVFSGSDWCGNCIRLERELFESDEFKAFANDKLVLLQADFPMRKKNKLSPEQTAHNEQLAEQFNKKGSFPMVVVLNPDGSMAGKMAYPADNNAAYLESLKQLTQ